MRALYVQRVAWFALLLALAAAAQAESCEETIRDHKPVGWE